VSENSLLNKPLLTYEVGSLAKPEWRVQGIKGGFSEADLERFVRQAKEQGQRYGVLEADIEHTVMLLGEIQARGKPLNDQRQALKELASVYAIRFLEHCGLDVVYDGEMQRSEMYRHMVEGIEDMAFLGLVRSFDNKYYNKAAAVGPMPVQAKEPIKLEAEFGANVGVSRQPLKVPITGAYTLMDWSFDNHYAEKLGVASGDPEARRAFALDLAQNVIRPNVQALVEAGAEWVQIDEPAATTKPDEMGLMVETFNKSVEGLEGRFTIHFCFSDYALLFPHIEALENCAGFCIGFAEYDSDEPGAYRPGYEILRRFEGLDYPFQLGVGVVDIHRDWIEPVELIADRIEYACEVLGEDRVQVCPDCGLRTRSWDVVEQKLKHMVEATVRARKRRKL